MTVATAGPGPRAGPARRHRRARAALRRPAVIRVVSIGAVAAAWEVVARVLLPDSDYIAPPSQVVTTGLAFLGDRDTVHALVVTTERFLLAFVIASVVGVVAGLALGRAGSYLPVARDVTSVVYALPLVPFYPLFVLWLGLGAPAEVAFGAVHGVLPVLLGTMAAAARVDRHLIEAAHAMGAPRHRVLGSVLFPATLPDVVGALRIGAALCLLGVLLGQLMINVDGVGFVINSLISNLRAPQLDAVILVVCVGAVCVNTVMTAAENRLSWWRRL